MRRLKHLLFVLLFTTNIAHAGFHVGGQLNVFNFFILPSGATGLSTGTQFGLGSVYGGYSLGDVVALRAFLSYDKTGTITGTGNLYGGTTVTFSGAFNVFIMGAELMVDPPFFPLYLKAGIGFGSLDASALPSPYDGLSMSFAANFGLGVAFNIGKTFKIHGGLDAVYVQIAPGTSGLTVNAGLPYFKTIAGITYNI